MKRHEETCGDIRDIRDLRDIRDIRDTVWLFSFVTFHDDVIPKVTQIIEFWKKFLKDYENTFYNVSIKGST